MTTRAKIETYLEANPYATEREIMKFLGLKSTNAVHEHLKRMGRKPVELRLEVKRLATLASLLPAAVKVLEDCQKKLKLYFEANQEYLGGVPYNMLEADLAATLQRISEATKAVEGKR